MAELLLGVNIDHIATLRNARGTAYPDPVQAAFIAEQAGADGITVHLREDRRHITDRDVRILRQTLDTRMNLEMAVTEEMLAIAVETKPHFCCLVPEKRQEVTTEGGLDVAGQRDKMRDACKRLADAGIQVSLFIDAPTAAVVEYAVGYLVAVAPFYPLLGFLLVYRSAEQSMGDSRSPFMACMVELVLRIAATTFLSRLIGYTGVCLASPLAWLGAISLLIPVYYRRMKLLTRGV